jgi:hypothetical protein
MTHDLEAKPLVEPSCVDAGDVGVQIYERRTKLLCSTAGRLNQRSPYTVASMGGRYDEGVNRRHDFCQLKVSSRMHGEETDYTIVLFRDEDLRSWFFSAPLNLVGRQLVAEVDQ